MGVVNGRKEIRKKKFIYKSTFSGGGGRARYQNPGLRVEVFVWDLVFV